MTDSSPDGDNSVISTNIGVKRRRKNANPSRYVAPGSVHASKRTNSAKTKGKVTIYCKNMACQAAMRHGDFFCKRCSCCICYNYDDNKDPSRWLTCNSDPPFVGESCGLQCHLDCVLNKSSLNEDTQPNDADGCFYCVSCGKRNSLLECWRKQLTIAKETRIVDQLCCRLVLAHKLLKGTKKYIRLSETVEKAVKSLETEFCGPLTGLPSVMCRGIVNRLSCAQEVKDYCSSALKLLEESPLDDLALPSKMQDVRATKEEEEGKELVKKEAVLENAVNEENSPSRGFELEHCVKIIRHLEISGHIKKNFRQKFLTWYTLRATAQEVNVVKAFIDVFKEDSIALAEQLVDTFSECILRKHYVVGGGVSGASAVVSSGFWMKSGN